MRILAMQASPLDQARLRLDLEVREIEECLEASQNPFNLKVKGALRRTDIQRILLGNEFDIIHYSGHSTADGELVLENAQGKSEPIANSVFKGLLCGLAKKTKLVVLNSCYSAVQAEALAECGPCVVGMSSAVRDQTAIAFAASFYQALAYGRSVAESYRLGCLAVEPVVPNLTPGAAADPENLFVTRLPVLLAEFELDEDDLPQMEGREYKIRVFVKNAASDMNACVYQYIDSSIPEDEEFDKIQNDGEGFSSYCSLYGDVIVRATLWSGNRASGFSRRLKDALKDNYSVNTSEPILKALKKISRE